MEYKNFNLDSKLQRGLDKAQYVECLPVQQSVLDKGLNGSDLYVQSQTGTGKTAAYLVTIIQRILIDGGGQALIMVPTRELVVQVQEEVSKLAQFTMLKSAGFYGGVGYDRQRNALKSGVDILIGTPGRVLDLQASGSMDVRAVSFLVIDEADRMFDMGFYPDLRRLIQVLPPVKKRQTMLFSATLSSYVKNLAWEYTNSAKEITIEPEHITVEEIEQKLFHVSSTEKMPFLLGIIKNEQPDTAIIFCNTKKSAEIVAKRLKHNAVAADFLIGDLPQKKRLAILARFKKTGAGYLVATDVAARGLDVDGLDMVVNYDLPNEAENYVHRIGRTARAGKTGKAYSLCSEQDVYNLPNIEKYLEKKIPVEVPDTGYFCDDSSAHIYIQLDNAHGSHRTGKASGKSAQGSSRHREQRKSEGLRTNSSTGSRRKKPHPNYNKKKDDRVRVPKKQQARNPETLAAMSFDERMDYYRAQYAKPKKHAGRAEKKKTTAHKTKSQQHVCADVPPAKNSGTEKTLHNTRKEKTGVMGFLKRIIGKA